MRLPLAFETNQGQTDAQVKFLSRGSGYNLYLTPTEAVLRLSKGHAKAKTLDHQSARRNPAGSLDPRARLEKGRRLAQQRSLGTSFLGHHCRCVNGANFGWVIKKREENQNGQVRYYSREGAALAGNANLGPRLVLVYSH